MLAPLRSSLVTSQAEYSVSVTGSGARTGPAPSTVPLSDRRNTYWRAGSVDVPVAYTVAERTGLPEILMLPRRNAHPLLALPGGSRAQTGRASQAAPSAVPNCAGAAHWLTRPWASRVRTVHQ